MGLNLSSLCGHLLTQDSTKAPQPLSGLKTEGAATQRPLGSAAQAGVRQPHAPSVPSTFCALCCPGSTDSVTLQTDAVNQSDRICPFKIVVLALICLGTEIFPPHFNIKQHINNI